jgi:uncharacterized protein YajQ (UPF0234 family)
MPSFDTVCEADFVEVKNAVDNATKEIGTRFDFKGTSAAVELKDKEITMYGDAEFQLQQVEDLLRNKLTKRNVDVRFLDIERPRRWAATRSSRSSRSRTASSPSWPRSCRS